MRPRAAAPFDSVRITPATSAPSTEISFDANVDRAGASLSVPPRRVGDYDVWDVEARYAAPFHATITLGIHNLFDRAPPFSNQPFTRQVGYDPTYADPAGRTYYVRLSYAFK